MIQSGARGFMRFSEEGGGLLVCDAAARSADHGEALCAALQKAGFLCRLDGALLYLEPDDALLERLCALRVAPQIDWASELHPVQAFAARLLKEERTEMTPTGRAFVLDTARLLWKPKRQVLRGMDVLRAQAAVLLREGDRTGFARAGALLYNWTIDQREDDAR